MKISVRNLGIINEAEIDLKPLTVLIGPNNAGKTWLAYTFGAVFGNYGQEKYLSAYLDEEITTVYPPLDMAIERVLSEGNAKIDLVQFADVYGELYFNDIAQHQRSWLQEYLDTSQRFSQNLTVNITLGDLKKHFLAQILEYSYERKISFGSGRNLNSSLLTLLKEAGKQEIFIYTSAEGATILTKLPVKVIKEAIAFNAFHALHFALNTTVNIFPAERTAFTAFPIFQLIGKQPSNIYVRRLPEPINSFKDMIEDAYRRDSFSRKKDAEKIPSIEAYIHLAQLLEKQVLGGDIDFSTPEPDPSREILYTPSGGPDIELPIASSMVKELASLVLYLHYLASPGDLLIIDEPEMNLHPEAQVKLTEFLGMLVNAGLHVLITTHSPYIVDHLTNLMKAAESNEPDAIQEKFYLRRKDAFISKNEVSVYLVDNGKTENMLDEDGVVHWGTFGKVSDRVSELYFEL